MDARLVDTPHSPRCCSGRAAVIDESWEAPDWCVPIKANVLSFEWEVGQPPLAAGLPPTLLLTTAHKNEWRRAPHSAWPSTGRST